MPHHCVILLAVATWIMYGSGYGSPSIIVYWVGGPLPSRGSLLQPGVELGSEGFHLLPTLPKSPYTLMFSLFCYLFFMCYFVYISFIYQSSFNEKKKIERKSYEEVHSPLMVFHKGQPCLCMCVLRERFMRN